MIDFKEYALQLNNRLKNTDIDFNKKLIKFLVDNEWFGIKPVLQNDVLMVEAGDFEPFYNRLESFFAKHNLNIEDKNVLLFTMLNNIYPDTSVKLKRFYEEYAFPKEIVYYLTDFLLNSLTFEVCSMNDDKVQKLLSLGYEDLSKQYGDILTIFLRWLKDEYKTNYLNDYFMVKRADRTDSNSAYDEEEYLELLYYLFNEDYISDNDMYIHAAESKNYSDTWLFLSLHFICALRNTDIVRIHHPRLSMTPQEVLSQVQDGIFPDEDARLTLYSITWRLAALQLTPNKTQKVNGVSSIKLCIPESIQVHMGTLFAIAEAHRLLEGIPDDNPLIRVISDYDRITRYMGDEIGALFLESNFKTRGSNKAYLQTVSMLTDDILDNDDEFNVKGYILAALARSHKGCYGEFAQTTAVYLKDAKLSKFTPEFVARELFERGVLSFIPSMMLKMLTNGEYNKLPVHKQTQLIKELNLSPYEVENIVSFSNKSIVQSTKLIKSIFSTDANKNEVIMQILHRIGNGNAVSKQDECLCLISAMNKLCPFPEKTNCISCNYEISTKSTMFLMLNEYKRLSLLWKNATDQKLKNKYMTILKTTVLPSMDEMLQCIQENYGTEAFKTLEKMVEESTNA